MVQSLQLKLTSQLDLVDHRTVISAANVVKLPEFDLVDIGQRHKELVSSLSKRRPHISSEFVDRNHRISTVTQEQVGNISLAISLRNLGRVYIRAAGVDFLHGFSDIDRVRAGPNLSGHTLRDRAADSRMARNSVET